MASIQNRVKVKAAASDVWAAMRDFGALHTRVVPGFVTDCRMDGSDARLVTFANGMTARELLVDANDASRRLVYAIVDGPAKHYSASVQISEQAGGGSEIAWTIDLLPNEMAAPVSGMAAQGVAAMKRQFGAA